MASVSGLRILILTPSYVSLSLPPLSNQNKRKKVYQHEESPEWPELVDMIVDEVVESERAYMKMKDQEFVNMKLRSNLTNKIAILCKLIEIFILGSLAFRPIVDWELEKLGLFIINLFNSEQPDAVILFNRAAQTLL